MTYFMGHKIYCLTYNYKIYIFIIKCKTLKKLVIKLKGFVMIENQL